MKLALIEPAKIQIGSAGSDRDALAGEKPQYQVPFTKPFYLGVYEVTQAQYQKVIGSNPSKFKGESLPVENVSWDDAQAFCRKLTDLAAERAAARRYRLPTKAEWEYAWQAVPRGTPLGNPSRSGTSTLGTTAMREARRTRWDRSSPTCGACTICMATSPTDYRCRLWRFRTE
jgi:formylglycine-generating enzyme required for sulfatase activity